MSDRDSTMWTLWWAAEDKQADMWCGNFESEAEAWEAQPAALAELLDQCPEAGTEEGDYFRAQTLAGSWSVEPPKTYA
jgi:hypothetical protein